MFDRSDSYSLIAFDIHKKSKRFIRMIAAYVMMNDEELNLDTFIERYNDDQFIMILKDATSEERRLQLNSIIIVFQRATVLRYNLFLCQNFRLKEFAVCH